MSLVLIAGCATDPAEPPADPPGQPIDLVWGATIRPGDFIAMVPGTGSYQFLAAPIEAIAAATGTDHPVVDVRQNATVAGDAIVFEQAIGAAHRAGLTDDQLATLTFGLWGAGFPTLEGFDYVSYEGLVIHVAILGGENSCATGDIFGNLLKYNTTDADTDANDLYARIQSYLAAHPSSAAPRNVIIASHSWGGAVAEYLAINLDTYEAAHGPLTDGDGIAPMAFTISAGVPGFILSMSLEGPGLKYLGEGELYEIDRPDDPVHALDPSGNGAGHQYSILFGDQFVGSYGVTTTEMSCNGVPGPCS